MGDDTTIIVFSFPNNVILDMSLADKMGKIQDDFRDLPGVQIFSVVGESSRKIIEILEKKPDDPNG